MPCNFDLWPYDPKIDMGYPWLMRSLCTKFDEGTWKAAVQKLFSVIQLMWPWSFFGPKINGCFAFIILCLFVKYEVAD